MEDYVIYREKSKTPKNKRSNIRKDHDIQKLVLKMKVASSVASKVNPQITNTAKVL